MSEKPETSERKLIIETTRAEIDAKTARFNAEAALFAAQARGQEIDNITAQALADSAKIALDRENLREEWEAAADHRQRVYNFTAPVAFETVELAVDILHRWSRMDTGNPRPYKFIICSNGGNVVEGLKLLSTLKAIAEERPVITVASGMCASMACVLHQAGSERVIEPNCSYLLHNVSGNAAGSIDSIQDTMSWLKMINTQLHKELARKSNKTVEEIATLCDRRDAWFMAEEVLAMGLADRIGYDLR